ncbi:GOLPH3/VPS74 family protein [Microtetraspora niveoalba]|uniref:GOLPH3/VPS74 family protein n=1 Tax=Microtetraspora niveoalba TaxID=46175 RepID=UPI000A027331|nr:GPP34 family phosphoprotein [Microtetraspora niveoalba]
MNRPPLYHDLYLIAHDQTGKPLVHLSSLSVGLAGAVLLDLALSGRLDITQGRLAVYDRSPIGDMIADSLVPVILKDRDNRDTRFWIKKVAEDVYDRACGGLVAAGVLTKVTRRRMGVMAQTRYQPADIAPVVRARAGVRGAAETGEQADARCAALCGLVGVLRLEGALHLAQPSGQLVGRLRAIAREYPRPVNEVIGVVETLITENAIALYR